MENAELIAVSTQTALRNQLNVVANNIANMNTNGFKSQNLRFEEFLMPVAEASLFKGTRDKTLSYVHDAESVHDFRPGATIETNAALDVAINGDGWFVVDTDNGERYSRDGNFSINTLGELVNKNGHKILGNGAPIVFGPDDTDIEIAKDGTISTSEGVRGQLTAVRFENTATLKPTGLGTYDAPDAKPATEVTFIQGVLEKSNTEAVTEITTLIDVTRKYESVSRIIKDLDDLREKAIGRLGRIQT